MTLRESLRVALEALAANKLRSVLTMIGIIIGVGSVIAIIAIGRGTQAAVVGEFEGLGTGLVQLMPGGGGIQDPNERVEPFTEQDLRNIRRLLPDVQEVVTLSGMMAPVKYERRSVQATVSGAPAVLPAVISLKVAEGRWFTPAEEESGARVVVIGADVAKRLMGEGVKPLGRTISIAGYPFQVIGVMEKDTGMLSRLANMEDQSYYVPLPFVRRVTGERRIDNVLIKVKPGADAEAVLKDAIALVERSHNGAKFQGITFAQVAGAIKSVTSILTGVVAAIASISLLVGGVGIMNIMMVSVTERTREIGVRKAIGATYRDILIQFLIEAVTLSLFGGLIGVALASLPVWLVGRWLKIALLIDWKAIALALGFSLGVGVVFGVYPASKAARLDPIAALRYE